ncbi:MAG: hypothetical protein ACYDEP_07490 [Acidimicrobiales bacterium]
MGGWLLGRLVKAGWSRGVSGEHWAWFAIALFAYLLRRASRPEGGSTTISLRRGETVVVTGSTGDPSGG